MYSRRLLSPVPLLRIGQLLVAGEVALVILLSTGFAPSSQTLAEKVDPNAVRSPANSTLTTAQMDERLKKNPNDVEILLVRANYCARNHSQSEALDYYKRVLKLAPRNLEALEICGKLNLAIRKFAAAVENFDMLEKLTPRAEVFSDGGDARFGVHDYAGAARDWLQCNKIKPDTTAYLERAGFGNFCLGNWLDGATCFEKSYQSKTKPTAWPLADAALACIGYGMAGKQDRQDTLLKDVAARKPANMDLFDAYCIDYLSGKIDAAALLKKKSGDPYYRAQSNFFIGFDLAGKGKLSEAKAHLSKCDISAWAATDDFKLPLEAIAMSYLARTK